MVLKLMGLCVLMARDEKSVPCTVLVDTRYIQSADGDLSTFSGHMIVCHKVLCSTTKDYNSSILHYTCLSKRDNTRRGSPVCF